MRFKFAIDSEKQLLLAKDVDGIIDRFFYEKPNKEDFDTSKWKSVVRIDVPCSRLAKLFQKFNPENNRASMAMDNVKQALQQLKIDMTEDEIKHVILCLDPKSKGHITYEDLLNAWIFLRRSKVMMEKKRTIAEKKKAKKKVKK